MALQIQANCKLTRCNIIFCFILLLGILSPSKIKAQSGNDELGSNNIFGQISIQNSQDQWKNNEKRNNELSLTAQKNLAEQGNNTLSNKQFNQTLTQRIQDQNPNNPLADNKLVQALSRRNLNFTFKMYKQMVNREDSMFSPLSISVALTMTSFGARNSTLKQTFNALNLNGFDNPMDVAKGYNAILQSLKTLKGTDVALNIVNRLFIDKNFNITKPFKDILVTEFQTQPDSFNFGDDGHDFYNEINQCVKQTTQNKIENLTLLANGEKIMGGVLVSAIYFKGKWAQQFRKENTKDEMFHLKHNKDHLEPTMHTRGEFYYAEDDILDSKVLKVEYAGFRFAMYVFLPNKLHGFQSMKNNLTAERFENIMKSMQLKEVAVTLPKFNSRCIKDLGLELKNLEIDKLEIQVDANMAHNQASTSSLFVKKVFYAAYVEMGEEGVEAMSKPEAPVPQASANGAGMGLPGAAAPAPPKEEPKHFYADHPFTFIIYDAFSNFILFIGNVDNPVH